MLFIKVAVAILGAKVLFMVAAHRGRRAGEILYPQGSPTGGIGMRLSLLNHTVADYTRPWFNIAIPQ